MKQYFHTFTVQGTGAFPLDMLRYDCCWPLTESDSYLMAMTVDDADYFKPRSVTLTRSTDRAWMPTDGRWNSFTWQVLAHHCS